MVCIQGGFDMNKYMPSVPVGLGIDLITRFPYIRSFLTTVPSVLENPYNSQALADYGPEGNNTVRIVLDNGAAEGHSVTSEDLVEAINLIKPWRVIPPDTVGDWRTTVYQLSAHRTSGHDLDYQQFMGIIQPDEVGSITESVDWWCFTTGLNYILALPKCLPDRMMAMEYLVHRFPDVKVHLLGADTTLQKDIDVCRRFRNNIISMDSGRPVEWASRNFEFDVIPKDQIWSGYATNESYWESQSYTETRLRKIAWAYGMMNAYLA